MHLSNASTAWLSVVKWTPACERGLSKTFIDISPAEVQAMHARREIAIFTNFAQTRWLALSVNDNALVCWSFQGDNANEMFLFLLQLARANKLTRIRWHTLHKGLGRLLKQYSPQLVEFDGRIRTYEVALT